MTLSNHHISLYPKESLIFKILIIEGREEPNKMQFFDFKVIYKKEDMYTTKRGDNLHMLCLLHCYEGQYV